MTNNVEAQETTVAALWDLARAVAQMTPEQRGSFAETPTPRLRKKSRQRSAERKPFYKVSSVAVTNEQLAVIRAALSAIVGAFGFAVAEIQ